MSFTNASKILTNRLKSYLGVLVNHNQSAFIKGRNISENILLAHELVKGYNKGKVTARCAIKADLRKAYILWIGISSLCACSQPVFHLKLSIG